MAPTEERICKYLEMKDIYAAMQNCPEDHRPAFQSSYKFKHNKRLLVQKLLESDPDWANVLLALVDTRAPTSESSRNQLKRTKRTEKQRATRQETACLAPTNGFLDLPTEEESKNIYTAYYEAASNAALTQSVCAVCARLMNRAAGKFLTLRLSDLPNQSRLVPKKPHDAQKFIEGFVLEEAGCFLQESERWINICYECYTDLKKATPLPPKYSLANNLWVGPIPRVLARLSLAENLLIALVYPRVFVVKLFPKYRGAEFLPESQIQHALRGNVTSFQVNCNDMVDMISGKLMPQPMLVLSTVLSITFVGRGKKPNPSALDIFRVQRDNIADALIWLKANNPKYYGTINIDPSRLNGLPVNDVPDKIKLNMRQEADPAIIAAESEGYVPIDDSITLEEHGFSSAPITGEDICEDPDVVPVQYLGVMDNEGTKITSQDILESGLKNLLKRTPDSEFYAIRHGAPTNTFGQPRRGEPADPNRGNHWERAFPVLYPYGVGGIESDRPVKLGFLDHSLMSAKLLTQRKDFPSIARVMQDISIQDLEKAKQEERQGMKPSNPAICILKDKATAIARRVIGSNASRAQLRSQIVSTSLYFNQPALWVTINPDDLNDPIAQIFAGAEIDMDNFSQTAGPSAKKRAENIAGDPFAAAQFFKHTITTLLETIFGIKTSASRVHSKLGVLGQVQAYFGTVECQGRGTLHLHMLIWLHGAPPPRKMKEQLMSEEFRLKIAAYLKANIRTYLPELHSPADLENIPVNPQVAYSRSPDPTTPLDVLTAKLKQTEVEVVRSKQMHKCDDNRCKREDRYGRQYCKRGAPWELSDHNTVSSDGTYQTKRTLGYLNSYCPWLAVTTKSNHDIKLCSYGTKATSLAFYCTKYMVKGEGRSHNTSSLLAKGLVYYYEETAKVRQLRQNQDDLIWKAFNVLNREQEVPAPMVITHLMGWGDAYKSHQYATIFWGSFISLIYKYYPELQWHREKPDTNQVEASTRPAEVSANIESSKVPVISNTAPDEDEVVVLQFDPEGRARPSSQIDDYTYQSSELETSTLLDYFVGTYEAKIPHKPDEGLPKGDFPPPEELPLLEESSMSAESHQRGRPLHQCIFYTVSHPRHDTHLRIIRPAQHNTLPNLVGPPFPNGSDPDQADRHAAAVLALLKPWRSPRDLRGIDQTWGEALASFMESCSQKSWDIIDNMEHYHTCKAAAEAGQGTSSVIEESQSIEEDTEAEVGQGLNSGSYRSDAITAEMVAEEKKKSLNSREMAHGLQAVRIGEAKDVFRQTKSSTVQQQAGTTSSTNLELLKEWQVLLEQSKTLTASSTEDRPTIDAARETANIVPLQSLAALSEAPRVEAIQCTMHEPSLNPIPTVQLNLEQARAFGIVQQHLSQHLLARCQSHAVQPKQLLMLLTGAGGTGKSRVIQTVTEEFERRGCTGMLIKSAFTGIAASLINGKTTHRIASIPVSNPSKALSSEAKRKLGIAWKTIDYLVIDEYSMLSKPFVARLSRNITTAKMEYDQTIGHLPFGGVNTILCGDLHQFPPVVGASKCALYHPTDLKLEQSNTDSQYGRAIYEKFQTVVTLKQQVRATDEIWQGFLERLCHGRVTDKDVEMLRKLTLTNRTLFELNGTTLRYFNIAEAPGRRPLALHEQFVAAKSGKDSNKAMGLKNGLPDEVHLAIGMKVMVTLNVETDLDIANGARGTIYDIKLSPNEPPISPDKPVVTLREPPAYILVEMERTKALVLPKLKQGIIPIIPATKNYRISIPVLQTTGEVKDVSRTVQRRQFPITPAYAFTNYRSQGQTIPTAIVDIATPPTGGGLTLANVYVALSRSAGRDNIRILRDFDESIFIKPVDYDLVKEDKRLEELDQQTKQWWEKTNHSK